MIIPTPIPVAGPPTQDKWVDASFFDVTLVNMVDALLASGKYSPGPLIMQLALSATAQIMIQTGRWTGADVAQMTLQEATDRLIRWVGTR